MELAIVAATLDICRYSARHGSAGTGCNSQRFPFLSSIPLVSPCYNREINRGVRPC